MSAIVHYDWVFWWLGLAMGAGGLLLGAWALFWDRAWGRRRCAKCWYDMAGVPGLTCPECGRAAKSERRLAKTRRRWRWTALAMVLLLAAYAAAIAPIVREHGFPRAVPNAVLIAALPCLESPAFFPRGRTTPSFRQRLFSELLDYRVAGGNLRGWERRWLIRKCVRARRAEPTRSRWSIYYGLLFDRLVDEAEWTRLPDDERHLSWRQGGSSFLLELTDADWDLLYHNRVRWTIGMRSRWPSGVPLRVGLGTDWIQAPTRGRNLELTPRFDGASIAWGSAHARTTHVNYGEFRSWYEDSVVLGVPPDGLEELVLDAVVSEGHWHQPLERVWKGTVRLPLRVGGTPDDVVRPIVAPEIDGALLAELRPLLRIYLGSHTAAVRLGLTAYMDAGSNPLTLNALARQPRTALAIRFDLLRDGQPAAHAEAWWCRVADELAAPFLCPPRTIISMDVVDHAAFADGRSGSWTLRLTGDAVVALRCTTCDSYWKGDLTVPVTLDTGQERW